MTSSRVLALLNRPSTDAAALVPGAPPYRFVDPAEPHVSAFDLAPTRGDGIFESLSVIGGRVQAFEHHLARFGRSARMLDLPAPDVEAWRAVILATVEELDPVDEAWVKIVLSRGVEGDGRPTGWASATVSPDYSTARRDGVSIVLLDRGVRHDVEATAPWLLAGAKTLSYAVNRAAVREAERRGAQDVVFVSSDGYLLEGPSATLIYRRGDSLLTPGPGLGILEGTTQVNAFRYAQSLGMTTGFELGTAETLTTADAAWLVSSVRMAAPINSIDGVPLAVDVELSAGINAYLLAVSE